MSLQDKNNFLFSQQVWVYPYLVMTRENVFNSDENIFPCHNILLFLHEV